MYSKDVSAWNTVMNNHAKPEDTPEQVIAKILRQSAFVVEEAKEIQTGAQKGDLQEILDGYLDTKFTNDQIGAYLDHMGVDIQGAWNEVVRSNNTKFSKDLPLMVESRAKFEAQGVEVAVVESPVPLTYVLKRVADGKIMKPICFEEPRLRAFIPKRLRKERV